MFKSNSFPIPFSKMGMKKKKKPSFLKFTAKSLFPKIKFFMCSKEFKITIKYFIG